MTQQGERREPDDQDEPPAWWSQLYDENAEDTGRSTTGDTLDDRFYSASRTLGGQRVSAPPDDQRTLYLSPGEPGGSGGSGRPAGQRARDPRENPVPATPRAPAAPDPAAPGPAAPGPAAGSTADGPPTASGQHTTGSARKTPAPRTAPAATPAGTGPHASTSGSRPSATAGAPAAPATDRPAAPAPAPSSTGEAQSSAALTPSGARPADAPSADAPSVDAPPAGASPAGPRARPETSELTQPVPRTGAPAVPEAGHVPEATVAVPRAGAPAGRSAAARPPAAAVDTLPRADPEDLAALVPDTVLEGAHHGSVTLRAVSTRGTAARRSGAPRGDTLVVARFGAGNDALVLIAVATGPAGPSRPAPEGGAPAAARAARALCHQVGDAVGHSHARLGEDIRAGRRGALKSGLQRITGRACGKLRSQAATLGLDPQEYTADLRCLLLSGDPESRVRVFFGVGSGGLFRLRDGHWQDIEPSLPAHAEVAVPAPAQPAAPPDPRTGLTSPSTPAELAAADGFQPVSAAPTQPFRFRASAARPGDVLLLCGTGLAEPLRADRDFAHHLAGRWAGGPPDPAAFLSDAQRPVPGYSGDRTAAALWES